MTKRSVNYHSLAFILFIVCSGHAYSQSTQLKEFTSMSDFEVESDSLLSYKNGPIANYEYLIRYYSFRVISKDTVVKQGIIIIRNDSIIKKYKSRPSVIGDIFAKNPQYSNEFNEGVNSRIIDKSEKKWVSQLGKLKGFYSQFIIINNKEFYPHNHVRCFVIYNSSGKFFGIVKYGSLDFEYGEIGKGEKDTLFKLVNSLF